MQTVQSRLHETNQLPAAEAGPLVQISEDTKQLQTEILSLYTSNLPPAVIHQIARGASEQAMIGRMMLQDCALRSSNGTLNSKHIANAHKWNASVRRWIEDKKAAYNSGCRRKFHLVRSGRPAQ